MPRYTFESPDGQRFTHRLSFADFKAIQAGEKKLLDDDDNELKLVFDPGAVGFVMKDGVSGGWPSKTAKERAYRQNRSGVMAKRERDNVFKPRLVPNYEGKEAHSWADVQDHVHTTDGAAAASTYNHLVAKEGSS